MCAAETTAVAAPLSSASRLESPRRIGVLGGMFDPVHLGHTGAARFVQQALGLEKVVLVPCGNPVHRQPPQASAPERCAMVALAIAGEPSLQLDNRECRTHAASYTVDTIVALGAAQPGTSWHLLVGVDAFLSLPSWKQWQTLLDLVNLVVMTRPGYPLEESSMAPALLVEWQRRHLADADDLASVTQGAIVTVDVKTPDLSSTRVRELVKTGGDPGSILGPVLHPAVAAHIRSHGLYLPGDQD